MCLKMDAGGSLSYSYCKEPISFVCKKGPEVIAAKHDLPRMCSHSLIWNPFSTAKGVADDRLQQPGDVTHAHTHTHLYDFHHQMACRLQFGVTSAAGGRTIPRTASVTGSTPITGPLGTWLEWFANKTTPNCSSSPTPTNRPSCKVPRPIPGSDGFSGSAQKATIMENKPVCRLPSGFLERDLHVDRRLQRP